MVAMTAERLTRADLLHFIAANDVDAVLIDEIGDTPTVAAAADALDVDPDQIIKTLLFLVNQPGDPELDPQPVVVISHGQRRVDKRTLATRWHVGKKQVSLASPDKVLALLGFPAGGVPPFGHRTSLPVIVDAAILTLRERYDGVIYGGGGDDRTMMRLTVDELLRVTAAEILACGSD